jgi:hypothetical protein
MLITGHKTAAVFRRYGIITESDLTEAVEKVAEFRKTERGRVVQISHSIATIGPNRRAASARQ